MQTGAEATLGRVPLFRGLGEDTLARVIDESRACRYAKGAVIFQEGDPGDSLLILLSGRAKVVLQNEEGQEVILSVIEPPDALGHIALLDGAERSATVIAIDALEARRLTRDHFLELVRENRQILDALLKQLATTLRETNEQVRTALLFDIHGQVLRALMKRGKELDESNIIVRLRPSHQEIAQMIGKARETVSRALHDLKEAGYLEVDGNTFLLKKKKLKRYWQG